MAMVEVIGLGIMGKPMALNRLKAGYSVHLHSRSGVPDNPRKASGTACDKPKEVAEQADVIIMMVPDTPDVAAILFGPAGVAEGLSQRKTVVDMSSISPVETKRFAERIGELGCSYFGAPVLGGGISAQ